MQILKSFHRIYLCKSKLDETVNFYMNIQGLARVHHEFYYDEFRLNIVAAGSFLFIAGDDKDTQKFAATKMTCLVDDLMSLRNYFQNNGLKIIDDVKTVPSGINMRVLNPDGTIVEYVQHSEEFKNSMSGYTAR